MPQVETLGKVTVKNNLVFYVKINLLDPIKKMARYILPPNSYTQGCNHYINLWGCLQLIFTIFVLFSPQRMGVGCNVRGVNSIYKAVHAILTPQILLLISHTPHLHLKHPHFHMVTHPSSDPAQHCLTPVMIDKIMTCRHFKLLYKVE